MRTGTMAVLPGVLSFGALAHAQAELPVPVGPEALEWFRRPGTPGLEAAWLVGAEKQPGLYALRVRLAAGAKIKPHTHPDPRSSLVLTGTLYVAFGTTVDESAFVVVPAGAVSVVPANQPHYLWAQDGEVVYQESGYGPSATVPRN